MPAPLYSMTLAVYWYQITSAEVPFPTSRALSALPAGDGSLINSGIAYYADPMFAGIYVKSNGLGGGNNRWIIECTAEMIGKKFKVYINFGNNWYVYEIQVWGPGTFTLNNPGSGPAVPNQIIFGEVVPVFEDFPENERDPNHPPPTYNPFEPIVTIEPQGGGPCDALANVYVRLTAPANIVITQALVYRNGVLYSVPLSDLLAGYVFTQSGDYELVVYYSFSSNPTETLVRYFAIPGNQYPHIQVERTYGGVIFPQTPVEFDNVLLSNGTIDIPGFNGQIVIYVCGVFFIRWFVVPEMGLTTEGADFAIVAGGAQMQQGSGHVRVSSPAGFSIVEVESAPYIVQLNNTSDGEIVRSNSTRLRQGFLL